MTARVTDSEVKGLFNYDISFDTSALINVANRYVDATLLTKGLTEAQLADIELWLSAHFTAIKQEEGGVIARRVGNSSVTYNMPSPKGFATTRFGQMAVSLDTSGTLANAAKTKFLFRAL